jgi:hypothetical protein
MRSRLRVHSDARIRDLEDNVATFPILAPLVTGRVPLSAIRVDGQRPAGVTLVPKRDRP